MAVIDAGKFGIIGVGQVSNLILRMQEQGIVDSLVKNGVS